TGNAREQNFTDDLLLGFIDDKQFLVERPDIHQPLGRRCLAASQAVHQIAHYEQKLPHETTSGYGKTISILRQSFAADAHLSVQSGALFKWSGTCAGQPHPRWQSNKSRSTG